jgi:hypothetical protein
MREYQTLRKLSKSEISFQSKVILRLCNGVLYFGCLIIVVCLFYLAFHIDKSDTLVKEIAPVFISGLTLILFSSVYRGVYDKTI